MEALPSCVGAIWDPHCADCRDWERVEAGNDAWELDLALAQTCLCSDFLAGTWLMVVARGLTAVVGPVGCVCWVSTVLSVLSGDQLEPAQDKRGAVA